MCTHNKEYIYIYLNVHNKDTMSHSLLQPYMYVHLLKGDFQQGMESMS